MPKIRTLKGEFFRDEDLSYNLVTKALAAGLICAMADDEGRFKASAGGIKGEVFTHDEVSTEEIADALARLATTGFVQLYEVNGKRFGAITNWKRHQPVPPTRFVPSNLPPPPAQADRKQDASTPQAVGTQAAGAAQADPKQGASGKEGEREVEGKGNRKGEESLTAPSDSEPRAREEIVLPGGVQVTGGGNGGYTPSPEGLKLVNRYLEITGNQPRGADPIKADEALGDLQYLGIDAMADSIKRHVQRQRDKGQIWPNSFAGFYKILRADNDYARDHGARERVGVS